MQAKTLTKTAVFVAVMCVCSYISIPSAIPFTMQTFAIFLACFVLGGKYAFIAVSIYLLLGAVGLPVFSSFGGGIITPTGGYLSGFLLHCAIYGAAVALKDNSIVKITSSLIGLTAIYAFGSIWFYFGYTSGGVGSFFGVLTQCVFPFIVPDIAKLCLAYFTSKALASR